MKKKIITIASLLLIAGAWFFTQSSTLVKKPATISRPWLDKEIPLGFDSAYVSELSKVGVNATKDYKLLTYSNGRKYWKNSCGLNFIGNDEMTSFLTDNNFILGDVGRYNESIPVDAGRALLINIKKVKSLDRPVYSYWTTGGAAFTLTKEEVIPEIAEGQTIEFVNWRSYPNGIITNEAMERTGLKADIFCSLRREKTTTNIMIIAAAKNFNTEGMNIKDNILTAPPPKDPIAVVKVQDGYVELASWE